MATKTIKEVNLSGKRVFVRCDFNVPIKDGTINDDSRIVAALPTIKLLVEQGAIVILASHLGRPKGEKNAKYTLAPVAEELAKQLGQPITFVEDCIGKEVISAGLSNGSPVSELMLKLTSCIPPSRIKVT